MKKRWMIFFILLIFVSSMFAGDIYLRLLTLGQPIQTYNLGDKLALEWYVNMEVQQTWWLTTEIGIGQNNTGTGENWANADWYEDAGDYKRVRRDIGEFQFTATGNWYFYGRAIAETNDPWHYATNGSFSNTETLTATEYFSVSALNNPTFSSVSKNSTYISTDIDLTLSEDVNGHNVLIVRREGSAVTWTPNQGTTYSDDEVLTDHEVVKGSYDPSVSGTTVTDNFLKPGTTYYYKVFSENWHYYSAGVEAAITYATTDALPKPSSVSSTMLSDSKIKVEWTANGTYGNVMVIARKGSDLSADPTNGTEYNVSNALGDGTVIFKGTGSNYTYTGLDANSTYYFRLYTAEDNSDYYSATDGTTSTNATTHDGTTYHTVTFTGSSSDFSADENVSGDGKYYLTWDDTYLYAGEFIDININLTANKFVIAIDKDPGTFNGYAPPEWGGYNFVANNDGTHNLEYIFAIGAYWNGETWVTFTNLYDNDSNNNFVDPTDKSGYAPETGNYAEVAIPWADLGGRPTSDWEIIMWFSNSSNTWMDSAWPSSNPTTGIFPLEVTDMHLFSSAGTGITPNSTGGATP
ncbi:MAG: hypothetical protein P9X26_09520, partial [Candidatus Stygibacter frigidus]|nr:hypothetical protein [Candidatus Stygibacter frigidus]